MKVKSSAENNFVTTVAEIPKKGDFQPTIPSKEPGKHVYKRSKVRQQNGVQSKTLDSVSHYQGMCWNLFHIRYMQVII